MAKKFIKGAFSLVEKVPDHDAFVEKYSAALQPLVTWADSKGVYVNVAIRLDDSCCCDFVAYATTTQMCKGYVAELKAMLKAIFPKTQLLYSASGDRVW